MGKVLTEFKICSTVVLKYLLTNHSDHYEMKQVVPVTRKYPYVLFLILLTNNKGQDRLGLACTLALFGQDYMFSATHTILLLTLSMLNKLRICKQNSADPDQTVPEGTV